MNKFTQIIDSNNIKSNNKDNILVWIEHDPELNILSIKGRKFNETSYEDIPFTLNENEFLIKKININKKYNFLPDHSGSINIVLDHTYISDWNENVENRLLPLNGEDGQILIKSNSGYKWKTINPNINKIIINNKDIFYRDQNNSCINITIDHNSILDWDRNIESRLIPKNGNSGQVLSKTNDHYEWINILEGIKEISINNKKFFNNKGFINIALNHDDIKDWDSTLENKLIPNNGKYKQILYKNQSNNSIWKYLLHSDIIDWNESIYSLLNDRLIPNNGISGQFLMKTDKGVNWKFLNIENKPYILSINKKEYYPSKDNNTIYITLDHTHISDWNNILKNKLIPDNGIKGQFLSRSYNNENEWININHTHISDWNNILKNKLIPNGGLNGQVLSKDKNEIKWTYLIPGIDEIIVNNNETFKNKNGLLNLNLTHESISDWDSILKDKLIPSDGLNGQFLVKNNDKIEWVSTNLGLNKISINNKYFFQNEDGIIDIKINHKSISDWDEILKDSIENRLIPSGGTSNQFLKKSNKSGYEWADIITGIHGISINNKSFFQNKNGNLNLNLTHKSISDWDLVLKDKIIPENGLNGQVLTKVNNKPKWESIHTGIKNIYISNKLFSSENDTININLTHDHISDWNDIAKNFSIPKGGLNNQVLIKFEDNIKWSFITHNSISDWDLVLKDKIIPENGLNGQVLTKVNNKPKWESIHTGIKNIYISNKLFSSENDTININLTHDHISDWNRILENKLVPPNGLSGQVLTKINNSFKWESLSHNHISDWDNILKNKLIPSNGFSGQILVKNEESFEWKFLKKGIDKININDKEYINANGVIDVTLNHDDIKDWDSTLENKLIPSGGIDNQVLTKKGDSFTWKTPDITIKKVNINNKSYLNKNGNVNITLNHDDIADWDSTLENKLIPSGGILGQVLTKENNSFTWKYPDVTVKKVNINDKPYLNEDGNVNITLNHEDIKDWDSTLDNKFENKLIPSGGVDNQVLTKEGNSFTWKTPDITVKKININDKSYLNKNGNVNITLNHDDIKDWDSSINKKLNIILNDKIIPAGGIKGQVITRIENNKIGWYYLNHDDIKDWDSTLENKLIPSGGVDDQVLTKKDESFIWKTPDVTVKKVNINNKPYLNEDGNVNITLNHDDIKDWDSSLNNKLENKLIPSGGVDDQVLTKKGNSFTWKTPDQTFKKININDKEYINVNGVIDVILNHEDIKDWDSTLDNKFDNKLVPSGGIDNQVLTKKGNSFTWKTPDVTVKKVNINNKSYLNENGIINVTLNHDDIDDWDSTLENKLIPSGGVDNQVLTKKGNLFTWKTPDVTVKKVNINDKSYLNKNGNVNITLNHDDIKDWDSSLNNKLIPSGGIDNQVLTKEGDSFTWKTPDITVKKVNINNKSYLNDNGNVNITLNHDDITDWNSTLENKLVPSGGVDDQVLTKEGDSFTWKTPDVTVKKVNINDKEYINDNGIVNVTLNHDDIADWDSTLENKLIPSGGNNGQILTKEGDSFTWKTPDQTFKKININDKEYINVNGVIDVTLNHDDIADWDSTLDNKFENKLIPSGGIDNQVLTKEGDSFTWKNPDVTVKKVNINNKSYLNDNGNVNVTLNHDDIADWDSTLENKLIPSGGVDNQILAKEGNSFTWKTVNEKNFPSHYGILGCICLDEPEVKFEGMIWIQGGSKNPIYVHSPKTMNVLTDKEAESSQDIPNFSIILENDKSL